jgi:hypothetical protein
MARGPCKTAETAEELVAGERKTKSGVASWYREIEEDIRQMRAAAQNAANRRAAPVQHAKARDATTASYRGLLDRKLQENHPLRYPLAPTR